MQRGTVRPYAMRNGDTSWRIQYRDSSGKLILETLGRESEGWTKKRAQSELAERIHKVVNKRFVKPKPITFGDYAETWYERGKALDKWDAGTLTDYKLIVNRLTEAFGRRRLSDFKRADLNAYVASLSEPGAKTETEGYAPRTISKIVIVLHMIFKSAVTDELIPRNPASGIERPKVKSYKPRVLTREEALAIEEKLDDPQVRFAFKVFKILGIRWCELQQLRWRDLDFTNQRLRIEESKTEEGERSLAVPWPLLQGFQAQYERSHYTAPSNYIFCNPETGHRWHARYYRRAVRAAAEAVGIENFRQAHDLRVTSITTGVLVGEHPDKLQARAGHRNYETTQGYIKLAGVCSRKRPTHLRSTSRGATGRTCLRPPSNPPPHATLPRAPLRWGSSSYPDDGKEP